MLLSNVAPVKNIRCSRYHGFTSIPVKHHGIATQKSQHPPVCKSYNIRDCVTKSLQCWKVTVKAVCLGANYI